MEKVRKPSDRIFEILIPKMEAKGFGYKKSGNKFLREFPLGKQEFAISFNGRGGLVSMDAGIFIHFESLNKIFKKILNNDIYFEVGSMLGSAGVNPWRIFLFDEKFAEMTAKELKNYTPADIYPESRITMGIEFFDNTFNQYAEPLFSKISTYQDLYSFYFDFLSNNNNGYWRPHEENVIYLSLILALVLDKDYEFIWQSGERMEEKYKQSLRETRYVARVFIVENMKKIQAYAQANDLSRLLEK